MRVISGKARGTNLNSLPGISTRPTLDKVKQAIFNMLFDKAYDANVLDLFAGSGAMGIESLSRGARGCTFVDCNNDAIDIVNKNISKAKFELQSIVVKSDYVSFLNNCKQKFDIVFVDPPYDLGYVANVLELLYKNDLLCDDAIVVVESAKDNIPQFTSMYSVTRQKFYGSVCVSLLEAKWKK